MPNFYFKMFFWHRRTHVIQLVCDIDIKGQQKWIVKIGGQMILLKSIDICFIPCAIELQSLTIYFHLLKLWNSIIKLLPSLTDTVGVQCLSKQRREKSDSGWKSAISLYNQLNLPSTLPKLPSILLKLPSDLEDNGHIDQVLTLTDGAFQLKLVKWRH